MGTRADFYVGRGEHAEWIGSITWDGHPDGIDEEIFAAQEEQDYRDAVGRFLAERRDATYPTEPWPWPWDNSRTTDYAYAFDGDQVYASNFGHTWFIPDVDAPDFGEAEDSVKEAEFPDMSGRKGSLDHIMGRSGMIVITPGVGVTAPNTFGLSDPAQADR